MCLCLCLCVRSKRISRHQSVCMRVCSVAGSCLLVRLSARVCVCLLHLDSQSKSIESHSPTARRHSLASNAGCCSQNVSPREQQQRWRRAAATHTLARSLAPFPLFPFFAPNLPRPLSCPLQWPIHCSKLSQTPKSPGLRFGAVFCRAHRV